MWRARNDLALPRFWDQVRARLVAEYGDLAAMIWYDRNNYFRCMATLVALSTNENPQELAAHLDLALELKIPSQYLVRLSTIIGL
jgi:hypothetical protein